VFVNWNGDGCAKSCLKGGWGHGEVGGRETAARGKGERVIAGKRLWRVDLVKVFVAAIIWVRGEDGTRLAWGEEKRSFCTRA